MEALVTHFRTVDIDLDVHKIIEAERRDFSETPNSVLRRLLNLPTATEELPDPQIVEGGRAWSGEGVTLPHGTALKMTYNGLRYDGKIYDGKWKVEGRVFSSPSGSASGVALTKSGKKTRLDGWSYWEVRVPGATQWSRLSDIRPTDDELERLSLTDLRL